MLSGFRWGLALLCLCYGAWASDDYQATVTGPPAGFEDFLEPQTTAVDVYYGGRFLVTTLAEFSDTRIRFLRPDEVVESLDRWKDRDEANALLSAELPTNDQLLCHYVQGPDCGTLRPDTVGVIFDVTRFSAELFVSPALLSRTAAGELQYLPGGDSQHVTAVQNLNLLLSGDSSDRRDDVRYSVFGRSRVGRNDRFGFAEFVSTDEQDLLVDELGYHHGQPDHGIDVGLFEASPETLRAAGRDLMMGVRVARSLDRLTDRDRLISTPLEVFLPRRSRVNVFSDGRLIETGFYEAGYQLIDTAGFPVGSYLVEIVVIDNAGGETREQRFFVKSSLLAPLGAPLWRVAFGSTGSRASHRLFPEIEQDWQLRGDYRWRQAQWLGLGAAGIVNKQEGLGELSATVLGGWFSAGGEVFASSRGASGWSLRGSARWRGSNLSLSSQHRSRSTGPADHQLVEQDLKTHSAFFSQRLGRTLLGLSVTRSQQSDGGSTSRRTLRLSQLIRLTGSSRLQVSANLSRVDADTQIGMTMQWLAGGSGWRYGAAHERIRDPRDGRTALRSTSAYSRWDGTLEDGARWNLNLNALTDDAGEQLSLDAEHLGAGGESSLGLTRRSSEHFNATQYTVGHQTSLVLGPDRRFHWGGLSPGLSAALVDLDGLESGSVDILVDGRRVMSTQTGEQVPLTLNPYREYQISVRDRGSRLLNLDGGEQRIVLYPGDVKPVSWSVERIDVLLAVVYTTTRHCLAGQLLCMDILEPLRSATILGANGWAETSASGFLQAEVVAGTPALEAMTNGGRCQIDLQAVETADGIMRSRMLICRRGGQSPELATTPTRS